MNPKETEALKPCPFCGGDAHWCPTYIDTDEPGTVTCANGCGATVICAGSKAVRIAAWNTRQSHSTPGDAEVRKALKNARDALLAVGNDYPGSSCQQWCTQKAQEAWNTLEPWKQCPSTHCERAQECRSINECSADRSTLAAPSWRAQGEVE